MGKYIFVYFGSSDGESGTMEAWQNWFGELGEKIIDPGNQFAGGGQAVHKGGIMDVKDMPASGYTIIKASSMDEAAGLAKGCPITSSTDGAVCVYEALPM